MAKFKTRKDRRKAALSWPYEAWTYEVKHICRGKKDCKRRTAILSRRRPIENEDPYKKLDSLWSYC